jgi:NAD(P)-dependent dehydrogenase (short-subunit alcohol dehydrogenase family)
LTTPQAPIGSGFGAASTADEVIAGIDLSGKTAIVTGGYSGIGLEPARVLRAAGAAVIVPARDLARAGKAVAGIDVELEPMDLLDPRSIEAFATKFLASSRPLHILINSAGIMATPPHPRRARVRSTVRHQPSRPLPVDDAAVARAPPRRGRARRLGFVVGSSPLAGSVRGSEFRAAAL